MCLRVATIYLSVKRLEARSKLTCGKGFAIQTSVLQAWHTSPARTGLSIPLRQTAAVRPSLPSRPSLTY